MRWLLALLLLALSSASMAQSRCAPIEDAVGVFGVVLDADVVNGTGPYMIWACVRIVDETGKPAESGQWMMTSRHCIEATWAELGLNALTNLGGRLETIRKAVDQVAAFHASYARHVVRTSPRCEALLAGYR